MNFYTNVTQWGNNLLVREVVNGERINTKVKYKPTLYAAVQEPTPFKTLKGKYVTPIQHDTIKEAKEWIETLEKIASGELPKDSTPSSMQEETSDDNSETPEDGSDKQ